MEITEKDTTVNGLTIRRQKKGILSTTQEDKISKLKNAATHKEFANLQALSQYIGACVCPNVCTPVKLKIGSTAQRSEDR